MKISMGCPVTARSRAHVGGAILFSFGIAGAILFSFGVATFSFGVATQNMWVVKLFLIWEKTYLS